MVKDLTNTDNLTNYHIILSICHPENQQQSIDDAGKIGKMYIKWCNVEDKKKKELRMGPTLKKKKKKYTYTYTS